VEHVPSLDRPIAAAGSVGGFAADARPEDRNAWWRSGRGLAAALALVALAELVGLLALAGVRLVPSLHRAAPRAAATPAPASHARAHARTPAVRHVAPMRALRPRSRVSVLVLNGNGRTGAAGTEAARLLGEGYRRATPLDAPNHDYARSLVLFAPGWEREARRLARDAHVRIVGPLDGLRPSQLHGAQVVVILGDS
jgi:hypothetical protein